MEQCSGVKVSLFKLCRQLAECQNFRGKWSDMRPRKKGIRTSDKDRQSRCHFRNIVKGLSSVYQSNFLRSYHKFLHKSCSNFISRISTKHKLKNLNQTSAFRLNLILKILTKPSFIILTKIKPHNLNKALAAKYWPNLSFKISTERQP